MAREILTTYESIIISTPTKGDWYMEVIQEVQNGPKTILGREARMILDKETATKLAATLIQEIPFDTLMTDSDFRIIHRLLREKFGEAPDEVWEAP